MAISRRALLQGAAALAASASYPSLPLFAQQAKKGLTIDCHAHYTTEVSSLPAFRKAQIAALKDNAPAPAPDKVTFVDDELRQSVQPQLKAQRDRGIDGTLFSPRANGMGHHIGTQQTSADWSGVCNRAIQRICTLYPDHFIGVGQLPQSPGVRPDNCIGELERCVKDYGFVAVNLNPDPSGGYWRDPPLTDRWWYPLYEKLVELDVPAMVHVSASTNPNLPTLGGFYLAADTTVFAQFMTSQLFKDFPKLRLIIPHGGGAVPYHWGRYEGLAQDGHTQRLEDLMGDNIYFDTAVYHEPGMEVLLKVVPHRNILFASEMIGAVVSINPRTNHYYDDTKSYINQIALSDQDRSMIFEGNARRVYGLDRTAFYKRRG